MLTKRVTLSLTSSAHFINDGNVIILPIVYAFLASQFGFSNFIVGLLGAIFFAVSALASPVVSHLADRSERPLRLMGLGIFIWVIGLDFFGISIAYLNHNIYLIFLSVFLCGFASAFYHPLGGTAVSEAYGGNAGKALGINGSFGSIGRALYPTLTLLLFDFLGQSTVNMFETIAIISFISFIDAIPALFSDFPADEPAPKAEKINNNNNNNHTTNSIIYIIILLTVITIIRSLFTQGVGNFLPILLVDQGYDYNSTLGFILTVTLAPAVLGQPFFGYLSDKYDRRYLFGLSNIGSAISFYLFLTIPSLIWLISFGFFTYSLFPLTISLIGDVVPKKSSNLSSGIVWGIGASGGGALGPLVVGILTEFMSLSSSLKVITVLGFLSGFLVVLIPKTQKRGKTPMFK